MTRKDYNRIAIALKCARPIRDRNRASAGTVELNAILYAAAENAWSEAVRQVAHSLGIENVRFGEERFYVECGLQTRQPNRRKERSF